jgi:hypothetical protein
MGEYGHQITSPTKTTPLLSHAPIKEKGSSQKSVRESETARSKSKPKEDPDRHGTFPLFVGFYPMLCVNVPLHKKR